MHPFMKLVAEMAKAEAEAIQRAVNQKPAIEMVEVRPDHFERKEK